MSAVQRGLIVGKFWPPHLGHHHLIDEVLHRCDEMFVVVCATDLQRPSGLDRALWIQQVHPRAEVIVAEDHCAHHAPKPCLPGCSQLWADVVQGLGLGPIDVVGTCEQYGAPFAAALGATHLHQQRVTSGLTGPLSATRVRNDLSAHWQDLHPVVRAGLYRRVVVLGAESTGSSTLARALASELGAPLVPEVGRTFSWARYASAGAMNQVVWDPETFWEIIDRQAQAESQSLLGAIETPPSSMGPWVVCDTDALATVAWWERYLSESSTAAAQFAAARPAALYLLTEPDGVAFADEPIRDGRHVRADMHRRLTELLVSSGVPWKLVSGSRQRRLRQALGAVHLHSESMPLFAS